MTDIRRATGAPVPYTDRKVALFLVASDGAVSWACTARERREAVRAAAAGVGTLYAAWGGQWRTDLFVVDDPSAAGRVLRVDEFSDGHACGGG